MFIATLLANPARSDLDALVAAAARTATGGGALRWLAPGLAAEFPLPALPQSLPEVQTDLRARGFDLCVQPDGQRRRKVLLADMDSTMIEQECIDELADMAGVGPRVAEVTARAMNGELDFEEALIARVALLQGLPEAVIARVLEERITFTPGGRALVATMRSNGAFCLLVSGGFTAFTAVVAQRLGFHEHRANTLIVEGGRLAGRVARPILGREAKRAALDEVAAARGLGPADVLAVGDGANDLAMLSRAGMGVALHAKPVVAEQCALRVDHGDLTALLYLQGYAASEFVSG
ncbi:MAG: phosphoserine phosphatase SerB [Rhodobacteraceae bacterium]|nr:phosphoserine phosphatase SerB [Paracoccaceae bacterium]